MTIKVAHIIDSGGFYGAEVMLLNLCQEQINQGLSVEVISIGLPGEPAKDLENKLTDHQIKVTAWRMKPLPDPREAIKIIRYCKSNNTDVIHSHGYKGNILLGILPKSLRKIPIVSTVHGYTKEKQFGKLFLYQIIDRVCLQRLDAAVIVSESMRQQIPTKTLSDKLYVVNNGLPDINQLQQSGNYNSLFKSDEMKIGTLGRFSFEKNFSLLIDAMRIVVKQLPRARLVIYGDGPLRHELQQQINQYELAQHIQLPGYLDDTPPFFAELDVFVNCSLTEGMPISLLEAMRQGCRVVATDIIANRCLLQSISCKTYLSTPVAEKLAENIIVALNESPEEVAAQKKSYQDTFREKFSSQLMARNYTEIYRKIKI